MPLGKSSSPLSPLSSPSPLCQLRLEMLKDAEQSVPDWLEDFANAAEPDSQAQGDVRFSQLITSSRLISFFLQNEGW